MKSLALLILTVPRTRCYKSVSSKRTYNFLLIFHIKFQVFHSKSKHRNSHLRQISTCINIYFRFLDKNEKVPKMKMVDVLVKSRCIRTLKCVKMKSEIGTYLLLYILGGISRHGYFAIFNRFS